MDLASEIKTINGGIAVDDRGSLRFINEFDPMVAGVRRFYQVENHRRGYIRAFHGHVKEAKYVYVASGSALIALAPLEKKSDQCVYTKTEVKKFVLSASLPKVLYIPPGYFNGFMNLEENTKVFFFSTSTIDESKGDDIRLPYDYWNVWTEDFR
jgi:dTDP-4-dehydrorhamnose 3,5-epimerase-like enzyme